MPLNFESTTEEKVPVRLAPTTTQGHPAKIDGKATLSILTGNATAVAATDEEIANDEVNGRKGLVGFVVSEDIPGVSTWQVSADTDLGAGVKTIVDGGTYSYNDPQAANLGLTSDAPVPKA